MASSGSSMAASQSSHGGTASNDVEGASEEAGNGVVNPKYPFWKHATKLAVDPSGRGGNMRFRCHFCMHDFPGSYTRIRAHLLKIANVGINACTRITQPIFEDLGKQDREAAVLIAHRTRNTLPLPPYEESGPSASSRKRKAAGQQSEISESFNSELRQQADALIARTFITGGAHLTLDEPELEAEIMDALT